MRNIHLEVSAGSHINSAIDTAARIAKASHALVRFRFNGRVIIATPNMSRHTLLWHWENESSRARQTWALSAKGQKSAEARRHTVMIRQAIADHLMSPAVLNRALAKGLHDTLLLLCGLTDPVNDVDVAFDRAALLSALQSAGYNAGEYVGQSPEWFCSKDRIGRYIIGQAMSCLEAGMPPHPMTLTFFEKYKALGN